VGEGIYMSIPRRSRLDQNTYEELKIRDAILAVEEIGADLILTEVVVLLGEAKNRLADFLDAKYKRLEEINGEIQTLARNVVYAGDPEFVKKHEDRISVLQKEKDSMAYLMQTNAHGGAKNMVK
jgi:hypothetical protein